MYPQRSVMTCGLATALEPPHFNHAPVRGATPAPDLRIRGRVVSIHAPAWGATIWICTCTASNAGFNPRTRVGCDAFPADYLGLVVEVSIHAPAWGATSDISRHGGSMAQFQSTHPRGVRQYRGHTGDGRGHVSIHAPAWGATGQPDAPGGAGGPVSIHAPAWGATSATAWRGWSRRSFNPRTRVGCDSPHVLFYARPSTFQSTHPRGVRRLPR